MNHSPEVHTFLCTEYKGCVRWLVLTHSTFRQVKMRHDELNWLVWELFGTYEPKYGQFSVSLSATVGKNGKTCPSNTSVRLLKNVKINLHRNDKKQTWRSEMLASLNCLNGLQLTVVCNHCSLHQQKSAWEKLSIPGHILHKTGKRHLTVYRRGIISNTVEAYCTFLLKTCIQWSVKFVCLCIHYIHTHAHTHIHIHTVCIYMYIKKNLGPLEFWTVLQDWCVTLHWVKFLMAYLGHYTENKVCHLFKVLVLLKE